MKWGNSVAALGTRVRSWNQASSARRLADCERGVFVIEMALITPVILVLVLAAYDISSAIRQKMTLQNAVRIGMHYGTIRPPVAGDLTGVVSAVKKTLPTEWLADTSNVTIDAKLVCECSASGTITCGTTCPVGEITMTFLNIKALKKYQPLFQYPTLSTQVDLSEESLVRLQ